MRAFGLPLLALLSLASPIASQETGPPRRTEFKERLLRLSLAPDSVGMSFGGTDILDDSERGEASWEIQFPPRRVPLWPERWPRPHPFAGVLATTDGSIYPYFGLAVHLPLSARFRFTPSLATGAYVHAGGFDLGSPVEFRSRAEIAYQVSERTRIGLSFGHLSNSGIRRRNPGTETLSLTFYSSLKRNGWGSE